MRTEAVLELRLTPTNEGGRKGPIFGLYHGTIMFNSISGFDMRSQIDDPLGPGESREIAVAFLSPELVKSELIVGKEFVLWEGRPVGHGRVLKTSL